MYWVPSSVSFRSPGSPTRSLLGDAQFSENLGREDKGQVHGHTAGRPQHWDQFTHLPDSRGFNHLALLLPLSTRCPDLTAAMSLHTPQGLVSPFTDVTRSSRSHVHSWITLVPGQGTSQVTGLSLPLVPDVPSMLVQGC